MAFVDLLIDTCDIQRNTPGVANAYGYPAPSWADEHSDQACRLVTGQGKEVKVGAEVVVADYKLFVEDIDITEQDRVLIDVDGVSKTFEVLLVMRRSNGIGAHHRECLMRTVR